MKKILYQSPVGSLILIADRGRLLYCNWNETECLPKQAAIESSLKRGEDCWEEEMVLQKVSTQLDEYFGGNRTDFDIPLDLRGTEFRKKVWRALRDIGYSDTLTYKGLAERIGNPKAFRAVAQACGANPMAIILPCHRVIGSHGSLGGYTGGLEKKLALLNLENDKKIKNFQS